MAIEARDIATLISVVNWARMPPFAFDVEPEPGAPGRQQLLDGVLLVAAGDARQLDGPDQVRDDRIGLGRIKKPAAAPWVPARECALPD